MLLKLPLGSVLLDYESPLLVISETLMRAQVEAFQGAAKELLPRHEVYYSMKTNDEPHVLSHMLRTVDGFEVVSGWELERALRLGATAKQLVFNGPNKSTCAIERALERGIRIINVDGLHDAERVLSAAERSGVVASIGVRLAFGDGGIWQKFGVSPDGEEFEQILALIRRSPALALRSLHHHGEAPEGLANLLRRIGSVWEHCATHRLEIPEINLGGGFEPAIEVGANGDWVENDRLSRAFGEIGAFWSERFGSDGPLLTLEPGRALVEGAMFAVASVGNIKRDRNQTFVFVDLSTGFVGGRHPCDRRVKFVLESDPDAPPQSCIIAGPMCYGSDVLGEATLAGVAPGRHLVMANAGAYTLTLRYHCPYPRPTLLWWPADGAPIRVSYPPSQNERA